MARPATREEYLARLVPPSVRGVDRRSLLRGALGTGVLLGAPTLLTACGGSGSSPKDASGATGTVTLGSNASDEVPKTALQAAIDGFRSTSGDLTVKVNTIDHNSFQENINNYLQGSPDDVFTWFAGYRMRFFASKGLAGDVTPAWDGIQGLSEAFKKSSTGDDGKQYFVPSTYYPWAVFYRKSVWQDKGYEVPTTVEELKALGAQMQKDGLTPIAFGDKDGWPAMGTFDQLNLRVNGYDFHVSLMAGEESWSDPKVKAVFETWRDLLPLHQPDSLGRTWQEAAQSLQQKKSGMYLLGLFVADQFPKEEVEDLDFFNFPEIDPAIGSDAIEAPIDGFMMAKRPRNEAGALKLLTAIGNADFQQAIVETSPGAVASNSQASTAKYTELQKKSVEFVANAKSIAQFLDRDTRPDFASTVMIPAIQDFIKDPKDIDGLLGSIEAQKKSIFAS